MESFLFFADVFCRGGLRIQTWYVDCSGASVVSHCSGIFLVVGHKLRGLTDLAAGPFLLCSVIIIDSLRPCFSLRCFLGRLKPLKRDPCAFIVSALVVEGCS